MDGGQLSDVTLATICCQSVRCGRPYLRWRGNRHVMCHFMASRNNNISPAHHPMASHTQLLRLKLVPCRSLWIHYTVSYSWPGRIDTPKAFESESIRRYVAVWQTRLF